MSESLPPIFAGVFPVTVDQKERVQIPATFRRAMQLNGSERLYGIEGGNGNLWLYPDQVYFAMGAAGGPAELAPTDVQNDFDLHHFGAAIPFSFDKQGRISLSRGTREDYELSHELVLVGVRHHIEIFDLALWSALNANKRERTRQKRQALKLRSGTNPAPVGTKSPAVPDEPPSHTSDGN